jgi:sigma-B regulation protein RsbU (phosphoserine phosphatase)
MVLGIVPNLRYTAVRRRLRPGDSLLLFTDGVTEARSPSRCLFDTAGVLAAVSGTRAASSAACLRDRIIGAVDRFCAGAPPCDDQCVLVVRRSPA